MSMLMKHWLKSSLMDRLTRNTPISSPEQLTGSDWTVDSVVSILDLMSYIRTERLIMSKLTE